MANTGLAMMMKSFGLDPEEIEKGIKGTGEFVKTKIQAIETRQEEMNAKLDKICAALDV